MLCHQGAAACLTRDHKPSDPLEAARVEAAGLFIAGNRVIGSLAMTRALGDCKYKTAEGESGRGPACCSGSRDRGWLAAGEKRY